MPYGARPPNMRPTPVEQSDTDLGFDPNTLPFSPFPQESQDILNQRQAVSASNERLKQAFGNAAQAGQNNSFMDSPLFQVGAPALLTALSAVFPRHMRTAGPVGASALNNLQYTNMLQNRMQQQQANDVASGAQKDFNSQRLQEAILESTLPPSDKESLTQYAKQNPAEASKAFYQRQDSFAKEQAQGGAYKAALTDKTPLPIGAEQKFTDPSTGATLVRKGPEEQKFTGNILNAVQLYPQRDGEDHDAYAARIEGVLKQWDQDKQDVKPDKQFPPVPLQNPQTGEFLGWADPNSGKFSPVTGAPAGASKSGVKVNINNKVEQELAQFDEVLTQAGKVKDLIPGIKAEHTSELGSKAAGMYQTARSSVGLNPSDEKYANYIPEVNTLNTLATGLLAKQSGRSNKAIMDRITKNLPATGDSAQLAEVKVKKLIDALNDYKAFKQAAQKLPNAPSQGTDTSNGGSIDGIYVPGQGLKRTKQ
jgi:hypothetical protein